MKHFLVLCLMAVASHALAQPRYGLSGDAYQVFALWMTTTCVGDEANAWRERLLRHKAQLVPAFRRALSEGPADDAVAAVRRAADTHYRAIAAMRVEDFRIEGVRPAPRAARQSFVDDQAARYVAGYKSNAIAALAILGDTGSRATLARLAQQRDNTLALPASEARRALDR